MRKKVQFHWDAEQKEAFDELKTALTGAPVLGTGYRCVRHLTWHRVIPG